MVYCVFIGLSLKIYDLVGSCPAFRTLLLCFNVILIVGSLRSSYLYVVYFLFITASLFCDLAKPKKGITYLWLPLPINQRRAGRLRYSSAGCSILHATLSGFLLVTRPVIACSLSLFSFYSAAILYSSIKPANLPFRSSSPLSPSFLFTLFYLFSVLFSSASYAFLRYLYIASLLNFSEF